MSLWPERIVCLTAETTEILFALGAGERIVGVSGYTVRPPEARLKEKVAAFTSVKMDKIRALNPDLIFAFSDLQKDIVRDLAGEGYTVFTSNQRSLREIGDLIIAVGRLIGLEGKAERLREEFFTALEDLSKRAASFPRPLRVYFEEWDGPLISGIQWVGEILSRLGGEDVFPELSNRKRAAEREVDPAEVIRRNPDVILASWCGKKVRTEAIRSRAGWEMIPAVKRNFIFEIKSADILQPGLSLIEGARRILEIFSSIHGV
jgi:iron complex transport system substrate-binding protein